MSTIMDPYIILELEPGAESREIIQAAAQALRKRNYSGHAIAQAQKELLDPVKKAAHAFLHSLDAEAQYMNSRLSSADQGKARDAQKRMSLELKRLTCFDENPG